MKAVESYLLKRHLSRLNRETAILDMDQYIQHGNTTCYWHCIAVAHYSVYFAGRLGINYDINSLIIGALLHDYFLYDWHIQDQSHRLHGFTHPNKAFINAQRDWHLNSIEADVIRKHMFPLTFIPPKYKESIIVCIIDKFCAMKEITQKNPYKQLKERYSK